MNILALNGSPRGENGNTEVILKKFLKGCEKADAEIETIYLQEKIIKHCRGCFSCWTKTPGKCFHIDDMQDLLVKVSEADIIIYASSLYSYTVKGIMKDFIDRMLPLNNREIVLAGKNYSHPRRIKKENPVKTVLISTCGFLGDYNFSCLMETFKVLTKGNLTGTILCNQERNGQAISPNEMIIDLHKDLLTALEDAGAEIVNQGYIKTETQMNLDKGIFYAATCDSDINDRENKSKKKSEKIALKEEEVLIKKRPENKVSLAEIGYDFKMA
ncbi:MAG: flavodoxin family protein [Acetobacterium sp.]